MLPFASNGHLTLGIEIELQLLDGKTLDLKPAALDVLKATDNPKIKPEIFQSMIEINTGICGDVQAAEKDLRETTALLQDACRAQGIKISATGTHPFAKYSERKLFPAERYQYLIDRNQWIARRLMIFGMHIHLGMKDGDSCIRYNNFFLRFIPHLLALTASSPFWQGGETGLASCRSTIFESCPTAGHPCRMQNWKEFSDLADMLIKTRAIGDLKDIWWDIRPSPTFGTMELRACDGPATLQETLAVTAFVHTLAHWYDAHLDYGQESQAPFMWIMRENKWRATRHGLEALLIDYETMNLIPLREDIAIWMKRIESFADKLGYKKYWEDLKSILERGASYERQLKAFVKEATPEAVTEHNAREFETGVPIYPSN